MYEDNKNTSVNWKPFFIKGAILILSVILLFIIMGFFSTNVTYGFFDKTNSYLSRMKDATEVYYSSNDLPSEISDTYTLTLKEMINNDLLSDFSNNGSTCSLTNSYAKVTKINENEYSVAIQVDCDNNIQYTITTITN